MSRDAIALLKEDHKTVKQMFRRLEKMKDDPGEEMEKLVGEICQELLVHAKVEEEMLYPMARETLDEELDVLEANEEHHVVEVLIGELLGMDSSDERYVAKAIVLKELVEHHIEEEEDEMFPEIREHLGRKELQEIGARIEDRKKELEARDVRELAEAS